MSQLKSKKKPATKPSVSFGSSVSTTRSKNSSHRLSSFSVSDSIYSSSSSFLLHNNNHIDTDSQLYQYFSSFGLTTEEIQKIQNSPFQR